MVCETYKLLQPTSAKDNDGSSKDTNEDSSKENKSKTKIKNKNGSSKSSEEKNDQNKKEEKTDDNEQDRIQNIQRQKSQLLDIEQQAEIEVTTLFATIKHGLLKQDSRSLEAGLNSLLGKKSVVFFEKKNSDQHI